MIIIVTGPAAAEDLGFTLMDEHVMAGAGGTNTDSSPCSATPKPTPPNR